MRAEGQKRKPQPFVKRGGGGVKKPKRRPRNGNYFEGMIVGGDSLLVDKYERLLNSYGIYIHRKLSARDDIAAEAKKIPETIEFVLMVRDTGISKEVRKDFANRARERDYCFVLDPMHHDDAVRILDRERFTAAPIDMASMTEPAVEAPELMQPEPEPPLPPPTAPEPLPAPLATGNDEVKDDDAIPSPPVSVKEVAKSKQAQIACGDLIRTLRQKKNLSVHAVALSLHMSSQNVYSIEQGKVAASDIFCIAFEKLIGQPHGTLPRLAHRLRSKQNIRLPSPDLRESPPLQAPAPEPSPTSVLAPIARAADSGQGGLSDREWFLLRVTRLQSEMITLGVESVALTPHSQNVIFVKVIP